MLPRSATLWTYFFLLIWVMWHQYLILKVCFETYKETLWSLLFQQCGENSFIPSIPRKLALQNCMVLYIVCPTFFSCKGFNMNIDIVQFYCNGRDWVVNGIHYSSPAATNQTILNGSLARRVFGICLVANFHHLQTRWSQPVC